MEGFLNTWVKYLRDNRSSNRPSEQAALIATSHLLELASFQRYFTKSKRRKVTAENGNATTFRDQAISLTTSSTGPIAIYGN